MNAVSKRLNIFSVISHEYEKQNKTKENIIQLQNNNTNVCAYMTLHLLIKKYGDYEEMRAFEFCLKYRN